jgi:hypothetical protein
MEAVRTLVERTAGLEQRLTELQSEYATLLDTDDSVDSLKKGSALATTIRVLEAKFSRFSGPTPRRSTSLLRATEARTLAKEAIDYGSEGCVFESRRVQIKC